MGNRLKRPVNSSWLAGVMDRKILGPDCVIDNICSIDDLANGALAFSKSFRQLSVEGSYTVIGPTDMFQDGISLIESNNPRLDFALALNKLGAEVGFCEHESTPIIHPNTKIGRNVVIGNGAEIGEGTVIYHNVVIHDGVKIGKRCLIKSGTIIGENGFGFERDEAGIPVRIIHLGSVEIGDDVELGSLNTICRGSLGNTIIEQHVKTDDHVHIAHNCIIRQGVLLTACVELSGGVEVGAFSWIGPNSSVIQKIKIGKNSFVGIASNVTKNVVDGATVAGNPARLLSSKNA